MPLAALRDGRALAWSVVGDDAGVPVLFFHGCPDSRRASWSGHAAAGAAGVRLIAASRPGYGDSTPAPPSYRGASRTAPSSRTRSAWTASRSWGCRSAARCAACAASLPERVTAAALVATPGEAWRMDPPYPRDDLDAGGRAFFADLAADSTEQNVARVRPDFMTWRTSVDPDVADDAALAERWLASLPPEDRVLVDGDPADVAGHAREAIGSPEGYLADAALVFAPWTFRVEDVRCPVTLWYGERDAHAPARNGTWLASTSHESH